MTMKKTLLALFVGTFLMISCEKKTEKVITTDINQDTINVENTDTLAPNDDTGLRVDDHNSRNSLDWNGTYHGTLPCADCEGIHTMVELNKDETFKLTQEYLNKNTKLEEKGKFSWSDNGGTITLNTKDKGTVYSFKVGEGRLFMLDQEGNEITGSLADKYILEKK